MQSCVSPLFKTLSLAGLLLAAAQSQALTICSGPCPSQSEPPSTTEILHYTYTGYLTDFTVMAEKPLPITLSQFHQSLGIAAGQPVALTVALDVQHTYTATGTKSISYNYSVSFGGISVFGPTTVAGKDGSPFQNDYDNYYDDDGPFDGTTINTASFRVESTDDVVALRSTSTDSKNVLMDSYGDRFFLTMLDPAAQAFAGNLPPNNTALEALFAGGRFYLKGGIQIRDDNGILIPFGSAQGDVWLNGLFSSTAAPLAPSRDVIQVTPCGDLDRICGGPLVPQPAVPLPGAGVLFVSGLLGMAASSRHRRPGRQRSAGRRDISMVAPA